MQHLKRGRSFRHTRNTSHDNIPGVLEKGWRHLLRRDASVPKGRGRLATTNCSGTPNWPGLIRPADSMFVQWNCISERSGGRGGGLLLEQTSGSYKAKGMSERIRIRGGWEKNVRERLLGLDCGPTEQGACGRGAILFRRPSVHRETWSNVLFCLFPRLLFQNKIDIKKWEIKQFLVILNDNDSWNPLNNLYYLLMVCVVLIYRYACFPDR